MTTTQVLSMKASIEYQGVGIGIRRRGYNGTRNVLVPREVVEWTVQHKEDIISALATKERGVRFETPWAQWRIVKSLYEGELYIGYTKYLDGERVG